MKPPKIIKIKFTKEQQKEIDLINKGETVPTIRTRTDKNGIKRDVVFNRRFTYDMGRRRLLQLYGGLCRCGSWPAYKIMFQVGDDKQGAWLVERYCQKCYDEREKYIKK